MMYYNTHYLLMLLPWEFPRLSTCLETDLLACLEVGIGLGPPNSTGGPLGYVGWPCFVVTGLAWWPNKLLGSSMESTDHRPTELLSPWFPGLSSHIRLNVIENIITNT
jgi:hypothetical protein